MLALTRHSGESIKIGPDIVIHFVKINGNQVKVAIDAPKEVLILRSELEEHWTPKGEQHGNC